VGVDGARRAGSRHRPAVAGVPAVSRTRGTGVPSSPRARGSGALERRRPAVVDPPLSMRSPCLLTALGNSTVTDHGDVLVGAR
jgi:hypothetical protein